MTEETPWDATTAHHRFVAGLSTPAAWMNNCLATIDRYESKVQALANWQREQVVAEAAAIAPDDARALAGVPIGVKDIIDVAGLPTACDSSLYADHLPMTDATCVELARVAGAIVVGKTRTTEFAYARPTITRNPHRLSHTPGGSSSGSAAGVAAGFFPLAFGTQTGGSTIRPASFCGIFGFKPTFNRIGRRGIKPLSESFDTLGWYARSVEDLALLDEVLSGENAAKLTTRPRLGLCRTPRWHRADKDMQMAIEKAAQALDATTVELPASFASLFEDHARIMAVDAARSLRPEWLLHRGALSDEIRRLVRQGLAITPADELTARRRLDDARLRLDDLFADIDALITPPAPGAAPATLASTGDSVFNRLWTALHVPCVALPLTMNADGLPLGLQLVGQRYGDRQLLAIAADVSAKLALVPPCPRFVD
ncbi:amidase [Salinicola salarius]|uniref:amidase n=1 Tax=Salinicola salarius TaxID=430457 RepID=UPI000B3F6FE7|nr:amidase [Salinicola salarius]